MKNTISKFIAIAVGIFILGMIASQIAMAMLGGKNPQSSYAQEAYNSALYNLCVTEKALSSAKLNDYFDGFIDLTNDDIVRLNTKRTSECSFQ